MKAHAEWPGLKCIHLMISVVGFTQLCIVKDTKKTYGGVRETEVCA